MRKIMMTVLGIVGFVCFLVICSEPAPGDEMSVSEFLEPKIWAFLTLLLAAWGIGKLNTPKED